MQYSLYRRSRFAVGRAEVVVFAAIAVDFGRPNASEEPAGLTMLSPMPWIRASWMLGLVLTCIGAVIAAEPEDAVERHRALAAQIGEDPAAGEADARSWLREAVQSGNPIAQGYARNAIGSALRARGRYDLSAVELDASIAIARRLGGDRLRALSSAHLGVTYSLAGLHGDALTAYQEAAEVYRASGDWSRLSAMLTNIGNVLSESGNAGEAMLHYRQSLELKRANGIQRGVASVLLNLSDVAHSQGDSEQAIALIEEALVEADKEGSRAARVSASISHALVLKDLGRLTEAQHWVEQASASVSEEHPAEQAYFLDAAARVALARGKGAESSTAGRPHLEHALDLQRRASELAERIDDPARRARVAALGSEILAELGRWRESREALQLAHEQRELAENRLGSDRYAVLTARYLSERDQRELADLRRREVEQGSELARQRGLAVLLGLLLVLAGAIAFGAWRRARERREDGLRLQAHIDALERALDDAEETRRSAQHLAAMNNRLLQLAGDELRTPSLQIRNTAERVLVEHTDDTTLARQIAAVAQAANEILRTSEQMVETGRQPQVEGFESDLVDVADLARGISAEVSSRLRGGARKVLLDVEQPCHAAVDGARLQLVLQELIQIAADLNPGQEPLGLRVFSEADQVVLRLDDPRQGMQRALERSAQGSDRAPGSLGLLWLDRVLESLGGRLGTGPQVAGLAGSLELRLPRARPGYPERQEQTQTDQG